MRVVWLNAVAAAPQNKTVYDKFIELWFSQQTQKNKTKTKRIDFIK